MKRAITILLILTLVFTLGCGGKEAPAPADMPDVTTPEAPADTTSAEVAEVESELEDIDALDEGLLSTELDDLDSELDFEI
jgi:hypothetical protein